MGQMQLVTLREGIEAFLIVAITAAYLRKTGRTALLPAVWWGTAAAVALSIALGGFLAEHAVTPLHEGLLALTAAALVISMVVYMRRVERRLRAEIGERLEASISGAGAGAWTAVFLFVVLMVTREGMEMAFITAALSRNEGAEALIAGALAGIALAATLGWLWSRYGQRLNLRLFFQATSIFLVLFALQLLFYAFHEFTEAGALPIDNAYWHLATEDAAEGVYAQIYSALLVLAPLSWLAWKGLPRRA